MRERVRERLSVALLAGELDGSRREIIDYRFPLLRDAEVRTAAELRVPLPAGNEDLHTVAVKLSEKLPRGQSGGQAPTRARLADLRNV